MVYLQIVFADSKFVDRSTSSLDNLSTANFSKSYSEPFVNSKLFLCLNNYLTVLFMPGMAALAGCPTSRFFHPPTNSWLPCGDVCPPNKTTDVDLGYCQKNCPGMIVSFVRNNLITTVAMYSFNLSVFKG